MERNFFAETVRNKKLKLMFLGTMFLLCGCGSKLIKEESQDNISGGGRRTHYKHGGLHGYKSLL